MVPLLEGGPIYINPRKGLDPFERMLDGTLAASNMYSILLGYFLFLLYIILFVFSNWSLSIASAFNIPVTFLIANPLQLAIWSLHAFEVQSLMGTSQMGGILGISERFCVLKLGKEW